MQIKYFKNILECILNNKLDGEFKSYIINETGKKEYISISSEEYKIEIFPLIFKCDESGDMIELYNLNFISLSTYNDTKRYRLTEKELVTSLLTAWNFIAKIEE